MTTMTTLNDVRAALVTRGYPAEEIDAMLDLAGRMILEGSLASKDDIAQLRVEAAEFKDEFRDFKIDVAVRFAELRADMDTKFAEFRADMDTKFAELRTEMNAKFAELRTEMNAKFAESRVENAKSENRIIKWVFGAIFAGVVLNTGITSLLLVVLPKIID